MASQIIILTINNLKDMSGVVVYQSKYGATKQYANWLGEALKLPVSKSNEILQEELKLYDCILLGTPVYFGKLKIKAWLQRNSKLLLNKKLFLFIVNTTSENDVERRNKYLDNNVPDELKPYCRFYFLPGRIIHKKLSLKDWFILKLVATFEKDPVKKKALHEDLNGVNKEKLLPLIHEAQASCSEKTGWWLYAV